MECEKVPFCPFYNNMMGVNEANEKMKKQYCLGDKQDCARYLLVRNLGGVPIPIYPDEMDKAKSFLAQQ